MVIDPHVPPLPPFGLYMYRSPRHNGQITHLLYCDGDITWPSTWRLTFTVGFTLFTCLPAAAAAAAAAAVLFM